MPFSATFIAPPSLFPVITLFVNSASLTPVKSNSAPAPTKIRVLSLAVNLSATNVVTPSESMFLYSSSWKSTGTDCFTIFRVELVNKILSAEIFAPSTVKSALFAASAPAVFVASRFANDHKPPANSWCSWLLGFQPVLAKIVSMESPHSIPNFFAKSKSVIDVSPSSNSVPTQFEFSEPPVVCQLHANFSSLDNSRKVNSTGPT